MFAKNLVWIVFLASFLVTTVRAESSSFTYDDVTVPEAYNLIESRASLVILDVRTQSEYDSGHIQNSHLIPVDELHERLKELNPAEEILVYCRTGVRSSTASQILSDNGFQHVYNMLGGITAWIENGYPVVLSPPSPVNATLCILLLSLVIIVVVSLFVLQKTRKRNATQSEVGNREEEVPQA